jgi:hypothetical protein
MFKNCPEHIEANLTNLVLRIGSLASISDKIDSLRCFSCDPPSQMVSGHENITSMKISIQFSAQNKIIPK